MSEGRPPSSSSSPASQEGGGPQGQSPQTNTTEGQWVKSSQDESDADSASSVVKVAWAEPLDATQGGERVAENGQQDQIFRQAMDEDTMPVTHEEQKLPTMENPVQQESPEDILTQEQQANTSIQTFYGTVVPYAEANIQSSQGGTITMLKGKEGTYIAKGEVVVRFDERDVQLELQQAMASKNSALQEVNQAESDFQTIQSNVERYQKLYEDGFVSKQEVDDLQNQLASAISALNSAKESVTQNDVEIEILQNTLKDFQVRAPISGLIDEKNYNLGEVYQGGDAIYHVIDVAQIYVDVEVPETYLRRIHEGMSVNVFFDAIGAQAFVGALETILPSGTAENRSFTAKVLVENQDFAIKPGMFARIEIPTNESNL